MPLMSCEISILKTAPTEITATYKGFLFDGVVILVQCTGMPAKQLKVEMCSKMNLPSRYLVVSFDQKKTRNLKRTALE